MRTIRLENAGHGPIAITNSEMSRSISDWNSVNIRKTSKFIVFERDDHGGMHKLRKDRKYAYRISLEKAITAAVIPKSMFNKIYNVLSVKGRDDVFCIKRPQ